MSMSMSMSMSGHVFDMYDIFYVRMNARVMSYACYVICYCYVLHMVY